MAPIKTFAIAAAIALGLTAVADSASARRGGGGGGHGGGHRGHYGHHHHGHHHYRGYWGSYWGAYWPGYWGSGWGYWGAPYIVYTQFDSQEPRGWLERDLAAATPPPPAPASENPNVQQWWYWCVSTRQYYPYAASCAEGWQRVAPQAAPRSEGTPGSPLLGDTAPSGE